MSDTKIFVATADFSKLISRANHTFDLTFNTQEMGEKGSILIPYLNLTGTLAFKIGAESLNDAEILSLPEVKEYPEQKSKSQRLRNVLYRLWEQRGKNGTSESFYNDYMEKIIEYYKDKLE